MNNFYGDTNCTRLNRECGDAGIFQFALPSLPWLPFTPMAPGPHKCHPGPTKTCLPEQSPRWSVLLSTGKTRPRFFFLRSPTTTPEVEIYQSRKSHCQLSSSITKAELYHVHHTLALPNFIYHTLPNSHDSLDKFSSVGVSDA